MSVKKKINWIQVDRKNFPGVRYYKHESRKHGVKFDRYFSGSYQVKGKRKFIGFGWESEKWTPVEVLKKINNYKHNMKIGDGPTSLKEEITMRDAKRQKIERASKKKEKEALTINDYFYLIYYPRIQKQKKIKTYQREESLFRVWINKNLGHMPFKKIRKADVENIFYDIVDSGRSIRTAEYTLTTLKQIWREAKDDGYSFDMPIISKSLQKKINQNNNSRIRFLSYKEAEKLLDSLKFKSPSVYEKTLISLHCGLRASEIFKLTWCQVDMVHGIFNIIDSKGSDRSVYMTQRVKGLFQTKKPGKPNTLVYPSRNRKPSNQISKVFQKTADKLFNEGIDDNRQKVVFHTCRHSAASWMVMQGISLYVVQKVLGHATITITERYSHLAPDQLQLAAGAIDKVAAENKVKNIIPFQKKA